MLEPFLFFQSCAAPLFKEPANVLPIRSTAAACRTLIKRSWTKRRPTKFSSGNCDVGCSSTLGGWWDEAYAPEVGWAIGGTREHAGEYDHDDANLLYDLLEHVIAPEFYDQDHLGVPRAWIDRVRASMTRLTEQFSSDRMVREYVEHAYLPAARAFLRRSADGVRLARELEAWSALLDERWQGVRFGRIFVHEAEQQWQFEIEAYLGEVPADFVQVQVYAEALGAQPAACVTMQGSGPIHGAVNGFLYRGSVPASRPAEHYTPRIVPCHPEGFVPMEASHITWRS